MRDRKSGQKARLSSPPQNKIILGSAKESGVGNRESGIGSRESGVGSRESGVGSRESGIGNRESGVGSRESGVGSRESGDCLSPAPLLPCSPAPLLPCSPAPLLPVPCFPPRVELYCYATLREQQALNRYQ
ncbi:hypothetical protein [Spirulina subsalsa]|uniref:hypothetical protein n=1 Tax=Spirulina subsalsa TaxID=54311 RepID=UPI00035C3DE6|nr:hypothetical protein [Spirulina subsalsa]